MMVTAVQILERLNRQEEDRVPFRVWRTRRHDQAKILCASNDLREDTIDRILILACPAGDQFSDLGSLFPEECRGALLSARAARFRKEPFEVALVRLTEREAVAAALGLVVLAER